MWSSSVPPLEHSQEVLGRECESNRNNSHRDDAVVGVNGEPGVVIGDALGRRARGGGVRVDVRWTDRGDVRRTDVQRRYRTRAESDGVGLRPVQLHIGAELVEHRNDWKTAAVQAGD